MWTQLYYCGGLLLGLAFIGIAIRIAWNVSKTDNTDVWAQIHMESMQRAARLAELKELEDDDN